MMKSSARSNNNSHIHHSLHSSHKGKGHDVSSTLPKNALASNLLDLGRGISTSNSSNNENTSENTNTNTSTSTNASENGERMSSAEAYVRRICPEFRPSNVPISPRRDIFAVIELGPHQFKVANGDVIHTEKVALDIGRSFEADKVLLIGTKTETLIGQPYIPTARVVLTVEEQARSETLLVLKKKRRKNYQRRHGHRQFYSVLRVNSIDYTLEGAQPFDESDDKETVEKVAQ